MVSAAAVIAVVTLVSGCSGSGSAAPVTVTLRSTVSPTPAAISTAVSTASSSTTPSASVPGSAAPGPKSGPPATGPDSGAPKPSASPAGPPSSSLGSSDSVPSSSSTSSPKPSSSASTTTATTTGAGGVIQPLADPDVPGPDHGPACPVAKQYSNEAPTGLRQDVIAGWKNVVKVAAAKGITMCLNDGKRSAAQQKALFNAYVKQFGAAMAKFYVLPPDKSAHVAGYAVDVQPAHAYLWLQGTKGRYGFCRIYSNEAWHFEYAAAYKTQGCPALSAEPHG